MTLEEKAKECIEEHTHKLVDKPTKQDIYTREESIFISGYKLGSKENGIQWQRSSRMTDKEHARKYAKESIRLTIRRWCNLNAEDVAFLACLYGLTYKNAEIKELKGQLRQAKKIIKGWLGDFYSPKAFYDKRAELVEQSEQFIEETK